MKHCITLLFFVIAFTGKAQFTPKGKSFYKKIMLSATTDVYRPWGDSVIFYQNINNPSDIYSDTVYYEMTANDTVSLSLALHDDFFFVPEDFSFDVQLIYGNPVSTVESNGVSSYGYGFWKSLDMRFADTALLTFCAKGDGVQSHMVKLTRMQQPVISDYQTHIYPNPVTGVVNIDLAAESETSFSIVNAEGRKVAEWTAYSSHQKDLSDLQSGIYFLQLSNAAESSVIKIEKIK